jgi:hypothetical protein
LIISMSTLDPVGTLRFDDVSINLMNVELWCKSIVEN